MAKATGLTFTAAQRIDVDGHVFYTRPGAVKLMGVCREVVREYVDSGLLPARRIGHRTYIDAIDIRHLLSTGPDAAKPRPLAG